MKKLRDHNVDDDYSTHWLCMVITGSAVAGVFAILFWLGSV